MFIEYKCKKCGAERCFSAVQKDKVVCKKCGSEMESTQDNISIDQYTTPEARYLADEAIYNTIGDRYSQKHRLEHL